MIVADLFCNGMLISKDLPNTQTTNVNDKYSNLNKKSDFVKIMKDQQERIASLDSSVKNNIYTKHGKETSNCKNEYFHLSDQRGDINYNGVVFHCDENNNALCLGDMSNKDNVLTIPLFGGGCLMVNRDNIDSLAKAIGMFRPEDIKRILDTIATDAKVKNKEKEIENTINKADIGIAGYQY